MGVNHGKVLGARTGGVAVLASLYRLYISVYTLSMTSRSHPGACSVHVSLEITLDATYRQLNRPLRL